MQINTEYYGTGRETLLNDIETTDYTIIDAINNGDLPKNEQFDLSICPWRIGDGSDIFDLRFPIISTTSPISASGEWDIGDHRVFKDHENGYLFYFCYNSNGWRTKSLWFDGRSKDITTTEIPTSYAQLRNDNKIITNFDYSKLCVGVKFYTNYGYIDINELEYYFNPQSYDPDGVFQVYGIAPLFYYWNGTSFSSPEIGLACLSKGAACGSSNPNAQYYDDEWFDSCINVCTNYFSIGSGVDSVQRYGTQGGVHDGTEWIDPYKVYDMIFTNAVNTPQTDFNNRPLLFQGGEHWQMKVSNYKPYDQWSTSIYIRPRLKLEDFETFAELKNYILTQIAYIGCYFVESDAPATSDYPLKNNANVYLPEITGGERAITTGNYAKGTAQSQWDNSNWSDDPWQHTPDPSKEDYDPNKYSDKTDWNNPTVTGFTAFSKEYKLTHLGVMDLCGQFYASLGQIVDGQTAEDYYNRTFLTNNPTDVIVSLRYYDIDLAKALPTTGDTTVPVTLGAYTTNVNGWRTDAGVKRFTLGSCTYHPHFGDFRDFEPYSYAELVIPYCGSLQISPSEFMGHKLQVDLVIDFGTGQCTAYVYRDNLVIDSLPGQIGVDVPVSAVASADLQRDLYNNAAQLRSAKISGQQALIGGVFSTVANIATGNIAGAVSSGVQTILGQEQAKNNIDVAQYNLEHTQVHYKQVGAATPGQSVLQERNARLIIYRPVMGTYDPATYGHTTGFACLDHSKLSNYTGFVQCANIVTDGIAATEQEKQLIIQALQSGVYV